MSGSLRAELLGERIPEWTVAVPPGWVRRDPTDAVRDDLLAKAKRRLMAAHRPDLWASVSDSTTQAFSRMARMETVAFFSPDADAPDSAYLPANLTASVRRGPDGASLDDEITHLIRDRGATALGGDKRFLRWVQDGSAAFDDSSVATVTVVYLTPIPETGRRRALQFTLVVIHDPSAEGDQDFVDDLVALFDAHIATFRWEGA